MPRRLTNSEYSRGPRMVVFSIVFVPILSLSVDFSYKCFLRSPRVNFSLRARFFSTGVVSGGLRRQEMRIFQARAISEFSIRHRRNRFPKRKASWREMHLRGMRFFRCFSYVAQINPLRPDIFSRL